MAKKKKENIFWSLIDKIQGDKVVWMIVIMLIMFSIVAIFASSSKLALQEGSTRIAILHDQLKIVGFGALIIFICYKIPNIGIIRRLSQLGFLVSMGFLCCLLFNFHTVEFNGAVRAISIGGLQIHVYEVVKVSMVMYLAWAVQSWQKDDFAIVNWLVRKSKKLSFLKSSIAKQFIYIYIPMILVCGCILKGSFSSAAFIGLIMLLTILIGGIRFRDMLLPAVVALAFGGFIIGLHYIAPEKILPRWDTWTSRLQPVDYEKIISEKGVWSEDGQKALDKIRQPESAKIAIKEGGLLGKGAGKSTQKHVVSVMFGDYMFSFIVEEFGLLGALLIITLYVSLLARGSIIVRSCNSTFAQTAVAGLTILISGQAFMHMFINVNIGPLTGQTLPLVSHGSSSFVCFCIAFGMILSISKIAKKNIEKETREAEPILSNSVDDNVEATLDELDNYDI